MGKKVWALIRLCRLNKPFLAIPFAGTAAYLASEGTPDLAKLVYLFCAAIAGFMAGNIFNGITDRKIDSVNPRTMDRPLVTGELTVKEASVALVVAVAIVITATVLINPVLILLLPIPLVLIFIYSLSKRYTWFCHFILATVNAVCPVAGWLIFGYWLDWRILIPGAIVFTWTVGFELIYSSQDIQYDIQEHTFSIPSVFGIKAAYIISAISHCITLILYVPLVIFTHCGAIFVILSAFSSLILVAEHIMVCKYNMNNAAKTFDMNQVYSLLIFLSAILDKQIYIPIF